MHRGTSLLARFVPFLSYDLPHFRRAQSVTAVVIQGLAAHKDELGSPLCPCRPASIASTPAQLRCPPVGPPDHSPRGCRHYDDKPAEVAQGFWNCPCVPMRRVPYPACRSPRSMAGPHLKPTDASCPRLPALPARSERKECHCMLFLTEENDFAGKEQACLRRPLLCPCRPGARCVRSAALQVITMGEITEATKGM